MKPGTIRFSTDSIRHEFQDYGSGETLLKLFEDMLKGSISAVNLPPIDVKNINDKWVVIKGNRRLYVFKQLEKYGYITEVPVRIYRERKSISVKPYDSVKIRGNVSLKKEMDDVVIRHDLKKCRDRATNRKEPQQ